MNKNKNILKNLAVYTLTLMITASLVGMPVSQLSAQSKLTEVQNNLNTELNKIETLTEEKKSVDTTARTLARELESLDAEIALSQKSLDETNQDISLIQDELFETREYISTLEKTIASQKLLIKEYINTLYTKKSVSLFEVILSNNKLSDLLGSVEKTGFMQDSISESITLIQAKEQEIVSEKQHLFDKEEELISLRRSQEQQKNLLEQTQQTKETLFAETRGEQSRYEALLKESFSVKRNLLNSIEILGGNSGRRGALSLEEAYNLASVNAARLGNRIRPEYLVGVMKIESGLGGNVGGFFYKDALSGCAAKPGNTTRLNFAREEQAFEKIVAKLGIPLTQPVSGCPFPKYIGTGGAMGPAQVMPATWLGYEARLEALKGSSVNPWDVGDAMLAMGVILLGKVGDQNIAGNDALERRAALCYLGGCNVKNMWYADSVLNEATRTKELLGK